MSFLDNVKNTFNRIFRKNAPLLTGETFKEESQTNNELEPKPEYIPLNLPEGEIVPYDDTILDVNSPEAIQKYKHNLKILIEQAKESGKINKFMIIREDDFFPNDWEWRVLSKDTNLDLVCTDLSFELRKFYAIEQMGEKPFVDFIGEKIPNPAVNYVDAMSKVDKTIGNVLLPSKFRSTKHFTLNTPLGVTGNYNAVDTNRNFIIMDNIDSFLSSGYAYSVADHDAYLDISHESLPISEQAIVLIDDSKYEEIIKDENIAKQLSQRKVVRFKGDSDIAIDMMLAQSGALPTTVGYMYAHYDQELRDIIENSIKSLAKENGLFYDKGHAGQNGHFSNYYDDKNRDYEQAFQRFVSFLQKKFPNHQNLFSEGSGLNRASSIDIIAQLGTSPLLDAIDEYNKSEAERISESLDLYKKDRASITPKIHKIFTSTISLINNFYKQGENYSSFEDRSKAEDSIQTFLQAGTVQEQVDAAMSVYEIISQKVRGKESAIQTDTISISTSSISNEPEKPELPKQTTFDEDGR